MNKSIHLSPKAIDRYNRITDDIDKRKDKKMTRKDINRLKELARELNLPKTSYKEREKRYRKHLMDKYGKNIS